AVGVNEIQVWVGIGGRGIEGRVLVDSDPEVLIQREISTAQGIIEVESRCIVVLGDGGCVNRVARHPSVDNGGAKFSRSCDGTADDSATIIHFLNTNDSMEVSPNQRSILGVDGAPKK
ncbi:hypothetical protein OFM52_29335, partial [Escherichia coli]|nr:hypothetical protein [Escherichia coli]